MSVLIKGMEMPKNCGDCWFEYAYEICESKYEDCPLIELPPHGDLVDKQRMAETNEQHYKIFEGDPDADYARRVVLRMLDQAPVVIPANVPDPNDGNIPAEEGEI